MIDEVQCLTKDELGALIVTMHKLSQRGLPVVLIGAGLPQVAKLAGETKSYAERLFDWKRIGPLSHDAINQAIRIPVEQRGVSVYSAELGVSGQCDVLEYHRGAAGIPLSGKEGLWQPYPVEYKRGRPREDTGDTLQLCAQAMCLESMLCCDIPEGALYYGEIRRRERVSFTPELRAEVRELLVEMHELYRRGYTPKVKPTKSCNACSLKELCLPKLMKSRAVSAYLRAAMEESP